MKRSKQEARHRGRRGGEQERMRAARAARPRGASLAPPASSAAAVPPCSATSSDAAQLDVERRPRASASAKG